MSRKPKRIKRAAFKKIPADVNLILQVGMESLQQGHLDGAESAFQKILQTTPCHVDALNFLGVVAQQKGDYEKAVRLAKKAVTSAATASTLSNLGSALRGDKQFPEAISAFEQALKIKPDLFEALFNLAGTRLEHGDFLEASLHFRKLTKIKPAMVEAHEGHYHALIGLGNFKEALCSIEKILTLFPDNLAAKIHQGVVLQSLNRLDDAKAIYEELLAANPSQAEALNNMGNVLSLQKRFHESLKYYQKAVSVKPSFIEAQMNLGWSLLQHGLRDEAIEHYKKLIDNHPEYPNLTSNYLFLLNYDPNLSPEKQRQAAEIWWHRHGARPKSSWPHHFPKKKKLPLRIGFISPDFRNHPVGTFFQPLLQELSRDKFHISCYSQAPPVNQDAVTAKIMEFSDRWRTINGKNDQTVAALIGRDKIDILIDLAGHSSNNRLAVMALKPAPIQVSWLGYVNTTGISAIDYRLTDAIADPPGSESNYSEAIVRLPRGFFCYSPPPDMPEIDQLPAIASGAITFGSLNNLAKISRQVCAVWAKILSKVPNSKLLWVGQPFSDNFIRERHLEIFNDFGIAADKIELVANLPMKEYLNLYNRIDIALDSFPHNGHTVTCHTLWMGVPLITLRGDRYAGRMGASVLTLAGMADLIAESKEAYVDIAVNLASNLENLALMRKGMRQRLLSSSMCDLKQFARDFENSLLEIWHKGPTPPQQTADSRGG